MTIDVLLLNKKATILTLSFDTSFCYRRQIMSFIKYLCNSVHNYDEYQKDKKDHKYLVDYLKSMFFKCDIVK